jgi:exodeoxyribonuclease V alpha subunit
MDEIVGRIASVTAYNGKWARASVRLADGTVVNCVGEALIGLVEGNDYKLSGRQRAHERYGVQLEVRVARLEVPQDENALCRYLRKNYAGCGQKTAAKFVEWAKGTPGGLDALREQLISNPAAVDFSAVTRRAVKMSANDGPEVLIYRNLSLRLGASGVRDYLLRRLAAWLFERVGTLDDPVSSSWGRLSANPYDPIRSLDGYGFATADGIARYLSFPASHPYRLGALATHALREGCESGGHTFLTDLEMETRIARHDPSVRASDAVRAAIDNGEPIVVSDEAYYPLGLYNCEVALAGHLGRRIAGPATPITTLSPERLAHEVSMAEWCMGETFRLDASQVAAVIGLLTSTCTVHTLTAGPGCGKTALMEVCVQVICALGAGQRIVFCAPTGKAAKVLGTRVKRLGMTSATVHATLGVEADGFHYNEENPLPADIVIADESSMNDLALTRALFDALPPGSHIVLLGDRDQLASVGPGQILSDMLELEADHRTLSTTHRNDGGILDVVEQARAGRCDCVGRPDVRFSHGLPSADATSMGRVIGVFLRAVGRCGIENVGLLMGARRGDAKVPGWNVTYMNEVLREHINPGGRRVPGTFLKLGDRVMIRQNLRLEQGEDANGKLRFEQVVNGDTGRLVECQMDSTGHAVAHLLIELDDGRVIRFPGAGLEALVLAYALTVHAAQGSEYREVIFVCTDGMPGFMHRGIVYTALSRARERLAVFADDDVLRRVCARPIPRRNSRLVQRACHAGASVRRDRVTNNSERACVGSVSKSHF